jgi:hypothetical protein
MNNKNYSTKITAEILPITKSLIHSSIVFKASLKRRLSVRAHREDKASRRLEIRRKATVSNKKARREGRRRQGGANPAATARDLASVA